MDLVRWADIQDSSDEDFDPRTSDFQQSWIKCISCDEVRGDTSERLQPISFTKNTWRKWYVALLVPLDFNAKYWKLSPNIISQYLEEHEWRGTLFAKPGSFLGALSYFLPPIAKGLVDQTISFDGMEQIQFCADTFSSQIPHGIMVLHSASASCFLFQGERKRRIVSIKYFIFCAALQRKMAFIIYIDKEFAPLCFPPRMLYDLNWTEKGKSVWCCLH